MSMKYNVPVENLSIMLNGSNIPNVVKSVDGGSALIVHLKNNEKLSAICTSSSWGSSKGLLEICGGVTEEEGIISDVFGGLSDANVFERFKYCYENNTRYYKKA